jgi:S-adenosylmethionine synthetase
MISDNNIPQTLLLTSDYVGNGQPDKTCDQTPDTTLDRCLLQDPVSPVAVDTALSKGSVVVLGIVATTFASLAVDDIVRETLRNVGHNEPGMDVEYSICEVINKLKIFRLSGTDVVLSSLNTRRHVVGGQVCHV